MSMSNQLGIEEVERKLEAAYKILTESGLTIGKFESVRTLIGGINPKPGYYLDENSDLG